MLGGNTEGGVVRVPDDVGDTVSECDRVAQIIVLDPVNEEVDGKSE